MLLMSWPKTAVTTNRPASSAYGPASPTTSIRSLRDQVGGAGLDHRRGQRDHRRHQHHRRPVDRPGRPLHREHAQHDQGAGREQPGDDRWHDPRRQQHDHAGEDRDGLPRAAQRHGLAADEPGRVDDEHAGRRPSRRARPTSPGPAARRRPPASAVAEVASPPRWIAEDHEVAALGGHARGHLSPMSGERGGMSTSASPVSRPTRPASPSLDRRARTGRRASGRGGRSAGIVGGVRVGQQPVAEQDAPRSSCRAAAGCPRARTRRTRTAGPRVDATPRR